MNAEWEFRRRRLAQYKADQQAKHLQAHPPDCVCTRCLDEAFGLPGELPPDIEEQMDARHADLGIRTVTDPRD